MKRQRECFVINMQLCTGCRACEIACSYHFKKVFAPTSSAIHVFRENGIGEIKMVFESDCDFCEGEKKPLCIKFCSPGAIQIISGQTSMVRNSKKTVES